MRIVRVIVLALLYILHITRTRMTEQAYSEIAHKEQPRVSGMIRSPVHDIRNTCSSVRFVRQQMRQTAWTSFAPGPVHCLQRPSGPSLASTLEMSFDGISGARKGPVVVNFRTFTSVKFFTVCALF
jgi:hypothetical protein